VRTNIALPKNRLDFCVFQEWSSRARWEDDSFIQTPSSRSMLRRKPSCASDCTLWQQQQPLPFAPFDAMRSVRKDSYDT
jgi:hypothetical protein